ncbi:MAG: sodium-translocating pyrophosphatase [Chloroflexi bacterium]|nr:sodium-translocating pyrophosphatase [Chloroflexota bacterium]
MDYMFIAAIAGVLGLAFALFAVLYVLKQGEGTQRMKDISLAIKEGALAFLRREYQILAFFVVAITVILAVIPDLGWRVAMAFLFGAICSMGAGYAGMNMAIRSNARTAAAAEKSLNQGLRVSFRAGAVMGMTVVGVGIIGLTILYYAFHTLDPKDFAEIIPAYGFGASAVALFARVGGGIYTKAADTGADLVGKVEKNIPEDDPRNAAVIADFVGDNVGDVAGMGADLFESYAESIIATMVLYAVAVPWLVQDNATAWLLPMMVAAGGIVASIMGALLVRVGEIPKMEALLAALRRGTFAASILTAVFAFLVIHFLAESLNPYWAVLAGLVAGVLIGESTNYFTSYAYGPTKSISQSSTSGTGPNIVSGFANGLLSVCPPFIFVVAALLIAYHFSSFYGVAIAGIGMLSTLGITLATDAYGPVADNSGGIVEMSHLPHEIRERTDALDSLGNTTAATGKGFAVGSAALTALALLLSYTVAVKIVTVNEVTGKVIFDPNFVKEMSLLNGPMMGALLLGVMLPAIFCALTLTSVRKTSVLIVEEVRRQFREIIGLMEGTARPEYGRCVDICTKAALRQMILPALMAIAAPVLVGYILGKFALVGFLAGATASGFLLAVTLANAGGSWDNAKKYIEMGKFGGKGSDPHKAAVVGDTVGDPMKDTSGPSLNIMIKLMAVIALVLAPVITSWDGLIH